jgi:hypothetical protein
MGIRACCVRSFVQQKVHGESNKKKYFVGGLGTMSDDALYPFLKELGKEQWPKRHPQRKHIPFFQSFRAAMSSSVVDEFIEANAKYAASFTKGSLPLPPGRKVAGAYSRSAWLYPLGGGSRSAM